jgi:hypothetical protein
MKYLVLLVLAGVGILAAGRVFSPESDGLFDGSMWSLVLPAAGPAPVFDPPPREPVEPMASSPQAPQPTAPAAAASVAASSPAVVDGGTLQSSVFSSRPAATTATTSHGPMAQARRAAQMMATPTGMQTGTSTSN